MRATSQVCHVPACGRAAGADRAGRRGFTLIEILGVVVILGIISAIILPQISSRDDQKAISGARVLVADVMYAQNRAIATQKPHYIVFDRPNNNYKVLDALPSGVIKHPVNGGPYLVQFGNGPNSTVRDATISMVGFDMQPVLAFDPMGVPHSYNMTTSSMTALNAGDVTVQSGDYKMIVSVAPFSGEVSLKSEAEAAATPPPSTP